MKVMVADTRVIDPDWLRWVLGASFIAVALWMLVPDKAEEVEGRGHGRLGVFGQELQQVDFAVLWMIR